MHEVTLYTRPACSYCQAAKQLLKGAGVRYREVVLGQDPQLAVEVMHRSGQRTVPQVFFCDESIGGFTELAALHRQTGLQGALESACPA